MGAKPTEIDLKYGLEPVFEPGGETSGLDGLEPFTNVECPYCGEVNLLRLDLSAGSQSYVEDCQVCCQPMQVAVTVSGDGSLDGVNAERIDR
jgi:hypothetical protein